MQATHPWMFFGIVAAVGLGNFAWGVAAGMPLSGWLLQKWKKPQPVPLAEESVGVS